MPRLDAWLVERGHYPSRARAQAAIKSGKVKIDGQVITKPSHQMKRESLIKADADHPFVSRAALKLKYALKFFETKPSGLICLDVGASTGGFTQVLCEAGAAKIYAVDVGTDQLHPDVRALPQVVSYEQTDARNLTHKHISEPIDLIVCDASFISATKVLEKPLSFAAPGATLITLVKPQFEVGKARLGKGGIVTDPAAREDAHSIVWHWLKSKGWQPSGACQSPIKGGSGNIEFLVRAVKQ